jgi:Ribonuclease G/E
MLKNEVAHPDRLDAKCYRVVRLYLGNLGSRLTREIVVLMMTSITMPDAGAIIQGVRIKDRNKTDHKYYKTPAQ